jgi:PEP-CTERM motif
MPAAFALVVPEPSTWAMLLIGFAGIGFASARHN